MPAPPVIRALAAASALFAALLFAATAAPQPAPTAPAASAPLDPTLGIAHHRPVFGGACKSCPWGAMADVVKAALAPYGYDVQVCYHCFMADAPRIVGDGRRPPSWS